ncbi:MAG: class I SAM-dependent methyltransferase [Gaiellaceae bacterium]
MKSTAVRRLLGIALLRRDLGGIRFIVPFIRSLSIERSPLEDATPWLNFRAIHWLASHIDETMRVFEYGSGGSTLFFAKRVHEVVSVEHDPAWYARTRAAIAAHAIVNCTYLLRPPKPTVQPQVTSTDPAYAGMDFAEYVAAIDAFPDASFDLVSVDGRARTACVFAALRKVKRGGVILLDDSDRPYYREAVEALAHRARSDFAGIAPYATDVSRTSVWTIDEPWRDN